LAEVVTLCVAQVTGVFVADGPRQPGRDRRLEFLAVAPKRLSGAEHRDQQQVDVGEHRGPFGSTARQATADFDQCSLKPIQPPHPTMESTI
jgi:hypothetical protein